MINTTTEMNKIKTISAKILPTADDAVLTGYVPLMYVTTVGYLAT